MPKENYRIQNGCYNCKRIFLKYEFDSRDYFYCTKDAPKRPLCMSVGMDEAPDTGNSRWLKAFNKWDKWSKDREVESYGICDNWKIK